MKRQSDSVRFDPYFKIQRWVARNHAWADIQKRYDTAEEARAAFPKGERCRVMRIDMEGRAPMEETNG